MTVESPTEDLKVDQEKLNKYYTSILVKISGAKNKKDIEEYEKKHKINFRIIGDISSTKPGQAYFSVFKGLRFITQRDVVFFLKNVKINPKL